MRPPPSEMDQYLATLFSQDLHPAKKRAAENAEVLGLGNISLSSYEGHLLRFLMRQIRPKNICELGTLTGHSALWLLESLLPGGKLTTLEKSSAHAELAAEVLMPRARELTVEVEQLVGDAVTLLPELKSKGPFCGVFIDANKSQYLTYWEFARQNLRPGGLLIADNVFLGGAVFSGAPSKFSAKQIQTLRTFNQTILSDIEFDSTILPTSEGLLISYKK